MLPLIGPGEDNLGHFSDPQTIVFILFDWLSGVLFKSFQDALTDITYTGGLNNKYSFLTILEIEKSKIKALADCVCWELASWFINNSLLDVSSYGRRGKGAHFL